jgi:hypothetical protein
MHSSRISSRSIAFVVATASFCLIAFFIQRWAKYFAAWMAWSVVNALMMASSGHLINNPSVTVPRSVALIMAGLMVITVIASLPMSSPHRVSV